MILNNSTTSRFTSLPPAILPVHRNAGFRPDDERLTVLDSNRLRSVLARAGDIRSDVVERGRTLATDGKYPPRAIIEHIARQIAASADLSME